MQSDSSIALVLCDILMPEQDGFDLLRFMKDNLRFSHIPAIMITVLHDKESVIKSLKLGAKDYIAKPIEAELLLSKIQNVLETGVGTILIVDDDELMLNLLERIIQQERYKTLTAQSANAGLELLKSSRVDLVISDIVLPGMDGLEFLVQIKDKYPHIPVVMITGHSGMYEKDDVIASGADGFITKPFHNTEITRTLKSFAQRF